VISVVSYALGKSLAGRFRGKFHVQPQVPAPEGVVDARIAQPRKCAADTMRISVKPGLSAGSR